MLSWNLAVLTERPGLPRVIIAVMASLLVIRAALFPGTGGDDGEQLIFSQYFDWGYQVRNPPLYTWLVIAVGKLTGPNLWAVNIVKFSLLTALYLFLWRAALRLFQSPKWAVLASLSPVLFYFAGWEVITGFSHTVLAATLYAGTFWILVRLREDHGRAIDFALLGLMIGLGGMAKYAYWIFLISLLTAALFDRDLRRSLVSAKMIVTLAVAASIAWPHYAWLAERMADLAAQAGDRGNAGAGLSLNGVGHATKAALGFVLPFTLFAVILFPQAIRPTGTGTRQTNPMARIIGLQIMLVLAGTLAGTLLIPEFRIRTHYMFALLLFPFWILLRAEAQASPENRISLYGGLISLALIAGPVGMMGKYLFEPLICNRCQHHLLYAELAKQFRADGFANGTIIAVSHPDPLPGNLRAVLPDARVISIKHPDIIPPLREPSGQCLLIWTADAGYQRKGDPISLANERLGAGISTRTPHRLISIPLESPLPGGTDRVATFGVIMVPGSGQCR